MSFNGGTHEGQTGNFEKEVLSCTSYKYMRLSMSDKSVECYTVCVGIFFFLLYPYIHNL